MADEGRRYEIRFELSDRASDRALRRFWWHTIGSTRIAVGLILGLFAAALWFDGDPDVPYIVALGTLAACVVAQPIHTYRSMRSAVRAERQYQWNHTVVMRFSERSFDVCAQDYSSSMSWRLVRAMRRYPDQYLLLVAGSYVAIPTEQVSPELREYVLARIRAGRQMRRRPRCIRCGYDLRGQTEPRCPECGLEFDTALLQRSREASMLNSTPDSTIPR